MTTPAEPEETKQNGWMQREEEVGLGGRGTAGSHGNVKGGEGWRKLEREREGGKERGVKKRCTCGAEGSVHREDMGEFGR